MNYLSEGSRHIDDYVQQVFFFSKVDHVTNLKALQIHHFIRLNHVAFFANKLKKQVK